jgi:hypothetical protein
MLHPMARQSKLPKTPQPMLATLVDTPSDGRDGVFEKQMGRLSHRCGDREAQRQALLTQWADRQRQLHADRQGAGEGRER